MRFFSFAKKIGENYADYAIPGVAALGLAGCVYQRQKSNTYEKKWYDAGYKKIAIGKTDVIGWTDSLGPHTDQIINYAWKKTNGVGQDDVEPYDNEKMNSPSR
jgi:hypothetical protein